ncbi:LytR C-terminal domain-containing protein [Candidatus Roizmanbacteria bacterium]|nr:LytR C-terminal domain-containing protein [Candidatus Roizmanbacteria bacterium]
MEPGQDTSSFLAGTPAEPKKGAGKVVATVVVVVLVVAGAFFGVRSYQQKQQEAAKKAAVTPTPTEAPTEEPTPEEEETTPSPTKKPTPAVSPTAGEVKTAYDMSVQVLNGSGEAGVAATARDFLSGKGYKNLEVGNADNFDYQGVTVRIKDSRKQFLLTLQKDLQEKYTLATGSGTLSADSLFDASVIVGK